MCVGKLLGIEVDYPFRDLEVGLVWMECDPTYANSPVRKQAHALLIELQAHINRACLEKDLASSQDISDADRPHRPIKM